MRNTRALAAILALTLASAYGWWVEAAPSTGEQGGPLYGDFVARNAAHVRPVAEQELDAEVRAVLASPQPRSVGFAKDQLRDALTAALGIGFLLDGIDGRAMEARVVEHRERDGFNQAHVRVQDPLLGDLDAWLLLPRPEGDVHPGVVGLHGHGESASDFVESHMGTDLARAGYAVIVPWSRAMGCDREESRTASYLRRQGFTLMGIRVYEALLAAKYLRSLPSVDPSRIGILGHSGGSSTANLAVRMTEWFAAQVADHQVDYRDLCGRRVHCETVPALFPLAADINDPRTLTIPRLTVPYGFASEETREDILDFLAHHLGPPAERPRQAAR